MTQLWFAGAEQPAHRSLLTECGVNRFALNLTNVQRVTRKKPLDMRDVLPDGAEWVIYADKKTTWAMAEEYVAQSPTLTLGPLEWLEHMGDDAATGRFAPFWQEGLESPDWPTIALTDDMVKNQTKLRHIQSVTVQSELLAITGSSRGVDRLDGLVTSAWFAAQKYGETQVWSGTKLHRYSGAVKHDVRPKHRADIERLNIDYDRVAADDPRETARLAVVSWQEWEAKNRTGRPNLSLIGGNGGEMSSNTEFSDQDGMGSAHRALRHPAGLGGHVVPGHAAFRDQVLLPNMALDLHTSTYRQGDGSEVMEDVAVVRTTEGSLRSCDSCYLAHACPQHQPGAQCAYKMPVEIRTKDQLQSVMRAMAEIQAQRVLFARFGEEVEGQGLDGVVSTELERFFRILAATKDISDTRDVLKLEMEAKGNAGMLSRLFGSQVGLQARQVSIPMTSETIMEVLDPDDPPPMPPTAG